MIRRKTIVALCSLATGAAAGAGAGDAAAAGWSVVSYPAGHGRQLSLNAASCSARDSCEAVGSRNFARGRSTAVAVRWNGRHWSTQPLEAPRGVEGGVLASVSCSSRSACTAVGYVFRLRPARVTPLIERWNRKRWAA